MARYDGGEGHFFLVTGVSTEMSVLPAFAEKVSLNILFKTLTQMKCILCVGRDGQFNEGMGASFNETRLVAFKLQCYRNLQHFL